MADLDSRLGALEEELNLVKQTLVEELIELRRQWEERVG